MRKTEGAGAMAQLRAKISELEQRIEDLLQTQSRLEAERNEHSLLYELSPLPALTLDTAYFVRRLNHAAAMLLGDVPEQVRDRSFRVFVVAQDRPAFSRHLARAAGDESIQSIRLHLTRPEEECIPVQLWTRYSTVRGSFELRLVDLREQERIEEQARRLSESERLARQESAAKDKFIAVLSHELRTPLTPVLATASALRRRPLPGELREAFAMIERNVSAEARLIDDLLDVNRIVRNKMHVECAPTDVQEIALEALENLRPDAELKGQELEVEFQAQKSHANVDPARLRQVFSNLLKNAIKFTPAGGNLRLCSWNTAGGVAVEVQDDGVGIEPERMAGLFEPFVEERGPSAAGGLGLGLTICKGLVELQGGKIAAHSRGRGHGSRFVVEFPTTAAPVLERSARSEVNAAPEAPGAEPRRVLLVEDHADTVEVLTALLVDRGFTVESATSVESARKVDLERVDVIVSDIGLPDGTGLELMKELLLRGRRPAIALTGFGMESDVRASMAAGFDLHLTKPVSIERLVEAIRSLAPSP